LLRYVATGPDTRTRLRVVSHQIRALNAVTVANYPAVARAIATGASRDDVVTAMTAASYETTFRLLFLAEHAVQGAQAVITRTC
jgi:hypothetical protein